MQRLLQVLSLVIFIIMASVVGCAYVPTQEMSDARQALKAAREAKAIAHVPTYLIIAEQSLTQAEHYLEQGHFKQARLTAQLATEQAVDAYRMTVAIVRAETVAQRLTKMGYSVAKVTTLLEQALAFAQQKKVAKTIMLANEAYRQGELALNQAQLEKAKLMIEYIKNQNTALNQTEQETLKLAQVAYRRYQGQESYNLIINLYNKLFYQ